MLNENDFPGTQVEISEFRWMYRSPQTPVWDCAKRTENKRNKADHGLIEYCGRSDWLGTHTKDGQRNDNGNPNHSAQCWHVGNHCSR